MSSESDQVKMFCPYCYYKGNHPVCLEEANKSLRCLWCHGLFANPENFSMRTVESDRVQAICIHCFHTGKHPYYLEKTNGLLICLRCLKTFSIDPKVREERKVRNQEEIQDDPMFDPQLDQPNH